MKMTASASRSNPWVAETVEIRKITPEIENVVTYHLAFSNPEIAAGYHFKPKGERVYSHSEQLSGVFNAYNFGVAGDQPNLTVQVSFFKDDEKRGQTEDAPFVAQAAQMALTIFDIPLNIPNFKEPGEYRIEIRVTDHVKNETVTEKIEIVVEGE